MAMVAIAVVLVIIISDNAVDNGFGMDGFGERHTFNLAKLAFGYKI